MDCTLCKDSGELKITGEYGMQVIPCYACKGTYVKSQQERKLREGELHATPERKPKSTTDILAHAVATGYRARS